MDSVTLPPQQRCAAPGCRQLPFGLQRPVSVLSFAAKAAHGRQFLFFVLHGCSRGNDVEFIIAHFQAGLYIF